MDKDLWRMVYRLIFGLKRIGLLRNWRALVNSVVGVLASLDYVVEAYVFGSVLSGRVTGSSDLDILVIVEDKVDRYRALAEIEDLLIERPGDTAYIIDLHVVRRDQLSIPIVKSFVRDGVLVYRRSS